jgi:membrane-bound serine protease (ClpP class)
MKRSTVLARRLALLWLALMMTTAGLALADDDDSAGDDDSAEADAPAVEASDPGQGKVLVATLDAMMINRGSKEYLLDAIDVAAEDPEIRALVIVIDTPGGVVEDTRLIVKAMLASPKPVITYISPPGSRGASAGVFITMAGHVAAMAPATHLGAAHPVFIMPTGGKGGDDQDEEAQQQAKDSEAAMLDKITEDTVSFIRNIAEVRGRNADWGEKAVRDSITAEVDEAVELNVVDLKSPTLAELLETIDGWVIDMVDRDQVVLRTKGPVVHHEMRLAHSVLYLLTDPTVAYLLLMAGLLGLGIELRNPGLIAPGAIGAVCLLLALFSLGSLPVNAIALIFVLIGAGLIVTDFFISSYGLLTIGGVASLAFGGLFLVRETPEVPVGVSPVVVAVVTGVTLVIALIIGWVILRDRERRVYTGQGGLVGAKGKVLRAIAGGIDESGQVFVQSERWSARSAVPIDVGARIVVRSVDGMVLEVEPVGPEALGN